MVGEHDPVADDGLDTTMSHASPATVLAGGLLIAAVVLLICLIPEANRDFYWQLRTGEDILRTGRLPHSDTYSWVRAGTPWNVPEWISFVIQALAYRAGAYFGTWIMMVALSSAAALLVWSWLIRRVRPFTALATTTLMIMAMALSIQERPYLFTYLLLAGSLIVIRTARSEQPKRLLWLLPIAALSANLHQGATLLPVLLAALAGGDFVSAIRTRDGRSVALAKMTAVIAIGCGLAEMVSPYGWGIYKNVAVTIGDPVAMQNVIEWSPVTRFHLEAFAGFYILAAVVVLGYIGTRRKRDFGEMVAVAGLLTASMLHVRDIPLFAIAATVFAAEHVDSAVGRVLKPAANRLNKSVARRIGTASSAVVAATFLTVLAHQCVGELRSELPSSTALTPEILGESVMTTDWYPSRPCDFMKLEGFPDGLRLYNDYGLGGYLIWALPRDRVFVDGRADIYTGAVLSDAVTIGDVSHRAARAAAVDRYPFDCVITGDEGQAKAFATTPGWALVYVDDDNRFILLRDTPEWRPLIERCQADLRAAHVGQ